MAKKSHAALPLRRKEKKEKTTNKMRTLTCKNARRKNGRVKRYDIINSWSRLIRVNIERKI
jgi:hypothetical protein